MKRQDELTRRIQCRRAKAAKRSQKGRQREKGRCTLGYLHTGDLRAVQDFLGHADPRMTAKYAHVVDMAKKNPALKRKQAAGNTPSFDLAGELVRIAGVDCCSQTGKVICG